MGETYKNLKLSTLVTDADEPLSNELRSHEPQLYSHRPTSVTTFLRCLFNEAVIREIQKRSPKVWQKLETSYVNFSHFAEEICHKNAYDSLNVEGLLAHFLRGCAIKCRQTQAGIDMVIPMVVLESENDLEKMVSESDISAIIFQIKNAKKDSNKFTTENLKKAKFGIQHIDGLSEGQMRPYLGIWMSFRATNNDIFMEGCEGPICITSTGDRYANFEGKDMRTASQAANHTSCPSEPRMADVQICSTPPTVLASEQSVTPRRSTRSMSRVESYCNRNQPSPSMQADSNKSQLKQVNESTDAVPPDTRLVIRGRGLERIYNPSLPLDILRRFSDRHQYSSSVSGLCFSTELIKQQALRGLWKLSSPEVVSRVKEKRRNAFGVQA